jgi:prolyl-tRNA synthetase
MRFSQALITTLRHDPADAEVPSHRLLVRAGYIQKLAAGLYIYSPLMWRTLQKVSNIVREEMNREGSYEILMPIMQPKDIWEQSGRWERYIADGIMFHLSDKKDAQLCLGPTHEEVVTTYVNKAVHSHKQLPVNVFQIQDKFRDEIRPRFGLMRGREFIMKDAYSFDIDDAALDRSYDAMQRAYHKIFERCGLKFRAVDADAGAIGGSGSQEFMVLADTGEDAVLICKDCAYAANVEKAESRLPPASHDDELRDMQCHDTPGIKSVDQLVVFFKLPASAMAKTLLYQAVYPDKKEVVAVMMRGDLAINEVKLVNTLDALTVKLADEKQVRNVTGAEVGFAGPVGLNEDVRILADMSLRNQKNLLTGCCTTDKHNLNVNPGRDFPEPQWADLRLATAGQGCQRCDGVLSETRGIEVGHIFKLGTKYSEAMNATFTASDGRQKHFVMGCYGIGVSRTAASAVEQNHDAQGIIWPEPIAPFRVVVAILDAKKEAQQQIGEKLYEKFNGLGIDACLDDRKMSPGAKFKDLDLLGIPHRVIVGRRAAEGIVEYSHRRDGLKREIAWDCLIENWPPKSEES